MPIYEIESETRPCAILFLTTFKLYIFTKYNIQNIPKYIANGLRLYPLCKQTVIFSNIRQ